MRSTLLCLGLLSLLSACSSGGGGGGAAAAGSGDPTVVAKAQALGTFTAEKESLLGEYGGVPQSFELTPAMKCGDIEAFDARLRAGDTFEQINASATTNSGSKTTQTSLVRAVTSKELTELMTITDTSTTPALGGSPTQVQVEATCKITEDKNDPFTCDFKYIGAQPPEREERETENCEADFESKRLAQTSGTVALGKFKLASGQVVNAQQIHRENTNVDIKCGKGSNKVVVGVGQVISDEVSTRELVTREASVCTPTTYILRKTVYQLEDGTVLAAWNNEITKAPQR